jgi:ribosomal-protein-alanine N-acetyltransferase
MDDLDPLYRIYTKPGVYRFIGNGQLPTYEQERERLHKHIEEHYPAYGFGLWATIYKENHQLIGRCGLISQEVDGKREVEIGYLLDPEYWGQGLATEAARAIRDYAFQMMKVNQLISLIQPQNFASIRVAEKNGMKLWKTVEFKGIPDVCVYRIFRSEWETMST